MPCTIIFHGTCETHWTDLEYLTKNQLSGIGEGSHTLSYFADCIQPSVEQVVEPLFEQCRALQLPNDEGLLKLSNELAVICGPDTTGTFVHDRIVSGLMIVLNAMMRGESVINVTGFSRGSVEVIHMLHELQRIKDYLNDTSKPQSVDQIVDYICERCYNPPGYFTGGWRTNRLNTYYKVALTQVLADPAVLQCLRDTINMVQLNVMLLDPVPGFCNSNNLPYLKWRAPMHYVAPAMIKKLTVVYMSDERSVGFRAVWINPTPGAATQIIRTHLPGFHSTANGNCVNHTPAITLNSSAQFPFTDMRDVQHLYLYKLLQFAVQNGVKLTTAEALSDRYLTPIFRQFIQKQASRVEQQHFMLLCYRRIAAHLSAYQQTRATYYIPSLGGLGGGVEERNGHRKLSVQENDKVIETSMADCFNFKISVEPDAHVNFEHYFLDFAADILTPLIGSLAGRIPEAIDYAAAQRFLADCFASEQNTNCYVLTQGVRTLLDKCNQQDANNSPWYRVISADTSSSQARIMQQLIELVTGRMADVYLQQAYTLQQAAACQDIQVILGMTLPAAGVSADSEQLAAKKSAFLSMWQDTMQKHIAQKVNECLQQQHSAARLLLLGHRINQLPPNPALVALRAAIDARLQAETDPYTNLSLWLQANLSIPMPRLTVSCQLFLYDQILRLYLCLIANLRAIQSIQQQFVALVCDLQKVSGLSLTALSGVGVICGMIVIAATVMLASSSGGVLTPVIAIGTGSGLSALGLFGMVQDDQTHNLCRPN